MTDIERPLKAVLKSRMVWATAVAASLAAGAGLAIGDTWPVRLYLAGSLGLAIGLVGFLAWLSRRRITTVYDRLDARIRRLDEQTGEFDLSMIERALSSPKMEMMPNPPAHRPTNPRVSVVVTTFNQARFVEDALKSVMAQTWTDFECIVVDANSTDTTVEKAYDLVHRDPRFIVVALDENTGPSVARNTGLAKSKGEFVTFLDGDDYFYPDSLEQRLQVLVAETDNGWVAGSYCVWHSVPEDSAREILAPDLARDRRNVTWFDGVTGAPFIVSAPLLRRDVLIAHGGFDTEVNSAEDTKLWSKVLRAGWIIRGTNTVGVAYRQRRQSWYRRSRSEHSSTTEAIVRQNTQAVEPHSIGPGPHKYTNDFGELTADRIKFERALIDVVGAVDGLAAEEIEPTLQLEWVEPWMTRVVDVFDTVRNASTRLNRHTEDALGVRSGELRTQVLEAIAPVLKTNPATGAPYSEYATLTSGAMDAPSVVAVTLRQSHPTEWRSSAMNDGGDVILLPSAGYHIDEMLPLARELVSRGLNPHILVSSKRWNNVRVNLRRADNIPISTYNPETFEQYADVVSGAAAIVTMNDWGEDREFLRIAKELRVPGFAKVEGVQDFEDDDVDRDRRAYQTAEYILAQGQNDLRNTRPAAFLVGSTRLERIWNEPPVLFDTPRAVINLNFTYGVLSHVRDAWLESAAEACEAEGIPFVVSLHPAERGAIREQYPVADEPIRHELTHATVLISRFSTVPFEAMARGVPFIYHNPHGERVPTFSQSQGAFPVTRSAAELRSALREVGKWVGTYRSRAELFFQAQVDIDPLSPSEARTAEVVLRAVSEQPIVPDRAAGGTLAAQGQCG